MSEREPYGKCRVNKAKALAMGLAVVLIGSCAQTKERWENPSRPERTWAGDEADCNRRASDIVEREFRRTERIRAGRDQRSATLTAKRDRHDAQRRQTDLFNRCMIDKGYARVPVEE